MAKKSSFLLLGIDGGATKVSGWEVLADEKTLSFSMGNHNAQKSYAEIPGFLPHFKPVDVSLQLRQRDAQEIELTGDEKQQGAVYVEASAVVIEELVQRTGRNSILVCLGMPGLKTADQRGIEVVANGPRILDYADSLEKRLALKGIWFEAPINRIGSDADYCGIGENYSTEGLFRDVDNAYYLGGGTGVADALKLKGKLLPFDRIKSWMAKSWEMKSEDGRSLERFASAGGIQALYAEIAGKDVAELNAKQIYPLQIAEFAAKGEKAAQEAFKLIVNNLGLLIYERITTIYSGWQNLFGFLNPNRPALSGDHPFREILMERIIIGQRLGELLDSPAGKSVLEKPLITRLQNLIKNSLVLDARAKSHYQNIERILVTSKLREAPALGAGIDAYLSFKKMTR